MSTSNSRPSKNDRRDAAREKARQLREEQRKKEKRNKLLVQGGLIVALLAVVAVVAFVITSSIKPPAAGPLNMLSDGVKIGQGFKAERTGSLLPDKEPIPSASNASSDVLDIRVYVDYLCPICGGFEAANADQIQKLVSDGAATLEIHPIAILDRLSQGTKYSTRSANAAACVANFSPDNFFDFSALLFKNQPAENTPGLDDETIIGFAKQAGVDKLKDITSCINSGTFDSWVEGATDRFINKAIPGVVTQPAQKGTPTIYVNGQLYPYTLNQQTGAFDPDEFSTFLVQVLGSNFSNQSTPSPSPSGSPSPSATP
ncbi:MAG: thioredoxin domain-containing protein [Microbacteriaceae bacterium]|nr:thioredoxin domain-containing protein [Cryobacterium sp.]MBX3104838.1 thioredoxin domain-containing protein [Cryobacterium sp.]MCC6375585.1 thioredoxin domain-containing protein [Microbacteriaceae bacterium]